MLHHFALAELRREILNRRMSIFMNAVRRYSIIDVMKRWNRHYFGKLVYHWTQQDMKKRRLNGYRLRCKS